MSEKSKTDRKFLSKDEKYYNRDLSWLDFNSRVLAQAEDSSTPLLERVKFLAIYSSNLDEFFMKRVGALKRTISFQLNSKEFPEGREMELLERIRAKVRDQLKRQAKCFETELMPELKNNGIHLKHIKDLSKKQLEYVNEYFKEKIFPVLTPLAVDPGHPFPLISNLSISIGVSLSHPKQTERLFARVKVPEVLSSWVAIPSKSRHEHSFVRLSEVVGENLGALFPDMTIHDSVLFRVTRNADLERDEEGADDLIEMITEELKQRKFAESVRLEVYQKPNSWMLNFLLDELELESDAVYSVESELDFTDLFEIASLPRTNLKYEPWHPVIPQAFRDESGEIFSIIKQRDHFVHHPFDSFNATVERFVLQSADDPKVIGIKMTLYRTGDESNIVSALKRAAESGKQVVCLVEVKARFDEERNIRWAQSLENSGVHVVYGIVGLKTHCKLALVIRKEGHEVNCYCHIGTGNYNSSTAKLYTDMGILTADRRVTNEVVELFHYLTGRSLKKGYEHLLVAPVNMSQRFIEMIHREIEFQKKGKPSKIIAKFNSLSDKETIKALYEASQAGVKIDLIVRGFCTLRPGIKGMSENIRVISVVGRFLEHSRVFYFRNGKKDPIEGDFFIGSGDWMYRNLHRRVECTAPIYSRAIKESIWHVFEVMLSDSTLAWELNSKGEYQKVKGQGLKGTHQTLMEFSKLESVSSLNN